MMPTVDREEFVRFGSAITKATNLFCRRHAMSKEDGTMLLLASVFYWARETGQSERLEELSRIAWGGQRLWEGKPQAEHETPLIIMPPDPIIEVR